MKKISHTLIFRQDIAKMSDFQVTASKSKPCCDCVMLL